MAREQGRKIVARNRRARHEYHIEDVYEAWLHNVHIPEYTQGTWTNHEPRRIRKLLMHRKEIDRLSSETAERGLTLIPLSLYFSDGKAKVELAVARGKRTYDKRHDLAKRDAAREVDRALRQRQRQ